MTTTFALLIAFIALKKKDKKLLNWMKAIMIFLILGIIAWCIFTITYRLPMDTSFTVTKNVKICHVLQTSTRYFPRLLVLTLYFVPVCIMCVVIHFYAKRLT